MQRPATARATWILAVAAIFVCAIWKRAQLPAEPFFTRDSWGYVAPSFSVLSGGEFTHVHRRESFYPAILLGILKIWEDCRAITVAQHTLGILSGVLMLIAWGRLLFFLPRGGLPGAQAAGVVMTALYLLSSNVIGYEHRLRPEAVTPFFIGLSFVLTLEFIRFRFFEKNPARHLLAGSALLINTFLLFMLRPAYGVTVGFATLPVWISLFERREPWLRKGALVIPALCLIAVLFRYEKRREAGDDEGNMFLHATLFTIHANLIADQMQADLAGNEPLHHDRPYLATVHRHLREEIEKSRAHGRYPSLGFDPDYLMYRPSIREELGRDFKDPAQLRAFFTYWYLRTVQKQPLAIVKKIMVQMSLFYTPGGAYRGLLKEEAISGNYENSVKAYVAQEEKLGQNLALGTRYLATSKELSTGNVFMRDPLPARIVIQTLSMLYPFVFLLVLVLLALRCFSEKWRAFPLILPLIVLLFYSYNLGNCLTTSILHSLQILRYTHTQFFFTLFSEIAGIWLLIEAAVWYVQKRSGFASPAPMPCIEKSVAFIRREFDANLV